MAETPENPTTTPASERAENLGGAPNLGNERRSLAPNGGKGRPRGAVNRVRADMKEMVTSFVERNIDGAQDLYDRVAARSPARALALLARFAGLVLPRQSAHSGSPLVQVNLSGSGEPVRPEDIQRHVLAMNSNIGITSIPGISHTGEAEVAPLPASTEDRP